jgi:hypothetical protein
MLRVEVGEVVSGPECRCCAKPGRSAFGFVHRGSETVAFYYAWLEPHRDRRAASLAISLGDWTHAGDVSTRRAAALRFEASKGEITGSFVDPKDTPFADRDLLGPFIMVSEMGESPLRSSFLEVAEAIVLEDPEVNVHLMA